MDKGVCAVRLGARLGRCARLRARVPDELPSGDRTTPDPRLVARSWQRVRAQGLSPEPGDPLSPVAPGQGEKPRTESSLSRVLPELRTGAALRPPFAWTAAVRAVG